MAPPKDRTEKLHRYLEYLHRHLLGEEEEEEEEEQSYGCIICGNPPFFIGHMEISNPNRMIVYCLCRECYEKPESENIAEKIIRYYEATKKDTPNLIDHLGEC